MWISRARYEVEKLKAEQRIEYLENLICPCEGHKWKMIGSHLEGGTGHGDEMTIYHYKCERCGKMKQSHNELFGR